MPLYSATAMDANGVRQTFLREADSPEELAAQLRAEKFLVIGISAATGRGVLPPALHPAWLLPMTSFDVEMGLRQISSMLHSGIPLLSALQTADEQGRNPRTRRTWRDVRDRIVQGAAFADSMEAHRRKFGEMAIRLARVGEQSGELDATLTRAADQMEARRNLRTIVANALVYPILAVVMTVGVTAFLVVAVIPKISEFLRASGATLPPMTQMLVDVSDWTLAHGLPILAGVLAAVAAWFAVRMTARGREAEDVLLLKIPVSGKILRLSGTAVLARAMQTMVASGVSLLDSLDVAAKLLANRRLRRRVERAHDDVMRGVALASALEAAPEFLPMLSRMAAVGEVTGSLSETFGETARFHEMMLGVAVKRFSVLIEPVMICITGAIVGFVYIAFFMAIFSLAGAG